MLVFYELDNSYFIISSNIDFINTNLVIVLVVAEALKHLLTYLSSVIHNLRYSSNDDFSDCASFVLNSIYEIDTIVYNAQSLTVFDIILPITLNTCSSLINSYCCLCLILLIWVFIYFICIWALLSVVILSSTDSSIEIFFPSKKKKKKKKQPLSDDVYLFKLREAVDVLPALEKFHQHKGWKVTGWCLKRSEGIIVLLSAY